MEVIAMDCRPNCGACCTAISISSPIPNMPNGKPAGVRCAHLQPDDRCGIFGQPDRPAICSAFQPDPEYCGTDRASAFVNITRLEALTAPTA